MVKTPLLNSQAVDISIELHPEMKW